MSALINIVDLSFYYEDRDALKNISLDIFKGDSVAVIGPNGSGKSTFLKILSGIYTATNGSYFLEETLINEKKLKDQYFSKIFHKRIGYIFQNSDTQLFCSNVYEEIAFGPRQMGIAEEEINTRVIDCLKLLNIEHLKHREPYHLSEGEKKKVAIASVLSLNPEVVILDEPMNNLDPRTKLFLCDFLKKLNNAGKTIICATHEFEYVKGLFSKVIVLSEKHTLIKIDDYENVISNDAFLREQNIK
jgi:cobalt/nickel transport system ATP-binding protein